MSTLSKKELHLQEMVNHAYAKINSIRDYMEVIMNTLKETNIIEDEKTDLMIELHETKVSLVEAHGELDEALDNMLGLNEEEPEPTWIVKPNLWEMLVS